MQFGFQKRVLQSEIEKNISIRSVHAFIGSISKQITIPVSTYRLQLHKDFRFQDVLHNISYLRSLDIDALYLSPYLKARAGSLHGYDIVDPHVINPEIGSNREYLELTKKLKQHKMGSIFDLVSNHMAGDCENLWWKDVLENGMHSFCAKIFDIHFYPSSSHLHEKILLPILEKPLSDYLESHAFTIKHANGEFYLIWKEGKLPLSMETSPYFLPEKGANELFEKVTAISKFDAKQDIDKVERFQKCEELKLQIASLYQSDPSFRKGLDENISNFCKRDNLYKDRFENLLSKQYYLLEEWQLANETINYRRFFDINDLPALRMSDEDVFEEYHKFVFELYAKGYIDGIRIDHPDGFYEPKVFFKWLYRHSTYHLFLYFYKEKFPNEKIDLIALKKIIWEYEFGIDHAPYIIVEKILESGERLKSSWSVNGTVGYEFLKDLNGIFVDSSNDQAFTTLYEEFIDAKMDALELLYTFKKAFAVKYLHSEIKTLSSDCYKYIQFAGHEIPFSKGDLEKGIIELFACLPVYRTYLSKENHSIDMQDEEVIRQTFKFLEKLPIKKSVFEFLMQAFSKQESSYKEIVRNFVMRFQQLSPSVMAKGYEDTLLYVYNRLLCLNEVGSDVNVFGVDVEGFHQRNKERFTETPFGFLCNSTHDTKRSEDMRARLCVLSEIPDEFSKWLHEFHNVVTATIGNLFPDKNVAYFFYQNLLGVFEETHSLIDIGKRLSAYMVKSLREGKIHSNWLKPNLAIEKKLTVGIEKLFQKECEIWNTFMPFFERLDLLGKYNSLSALIVRLGSPGVFDLYQGCELFNYSLVDPDNRRSVNFEKRFDLLKRMKSEKIGADVFFIQESFSTGLIKLYLTYLGLNHRRNYPALYLQGEYIPLKIEGKLQNHVIAFMREDNGKKAIFIAGRFFSKILKNQVVDWCDTKICVSKMYENTDWTDLITGSQPGSFYLKDICRKLPMAILVD